MRKFKVFFILITVILLFSAKFIYADEQASATPITTPAPVETPMSSEMPTSVATPTPIVTPTYVQPTVSVDSLSISGITDNPLYTELLAKRNIKNKLTEEENQVCKDIREQEALNRKIALSIIDRSRSYNEPYRKIIDDIKLLLNPTKQQTALDLAGLAQSGGNTDADGTANLNKKLELYSNKISSLNLAIKGMRESMKYISIENAAYNQKLNAVQKKINDINASIESLNRMVIEDKITKEIEWENFCIYMDSKDVKSALSTYGNVIVFKERIVKNYKEILNLKDKIEDLLLSV
ncbi:hypothetical protein [Pseudobacteroides cellulosolvens]|uniref:Uncharacterized protein n=1 Tax=Pseudobacteroides cellulosolvens ATCC 35603 = DSM 2933 TaxID=398512 RepID=A0A0L6JMP3_9FIRM|nr:hypothetical protein [Pseudobacteroides cellulosolvens]KNY27066.1 hypothetical protein Bccel_2331 [Pseudobacteroides cellulosolvens ATCC 35603 = DSM 2933]